MAQILKAATMIRHLGLIPHPEGGYFLEVHRSGSVPMTTKGQTNLSAKTEFVMENCNSPVEKNTDVDTGTCSRKISHVGGDGYESLTIALSRSSRRPDSDVRRNCLTSIFWMPTVASPVLPLGVNLSDHVHYYQGGASFVYLLYDPETQELSQVVLGGNVIAGEKLQVPVRGGVWKCGMLIAEDSPLDTPDYCLIGEAVGPGFDFHDFSWITRQEIPDHVCDQLEPFVHQRIEELADTESTVNDATKYYVQRMSITKSAGK